MYIVRQASQRSLVLALSLCLTTLLALVFITDTHRLLAHAPSVPLLPSHHTCNRTNIISPGRAPSPWILDLRTLAFDTPQPVEHVPRLDYNVSLPRSPGMMVPDAVHYILLSNDGVNGAPLSYWQYLSIRSALQVQKPSVLYFHSDVEPTGPWWNEISPLITFSQVPSPDRIFGTRVQVIAHKTDILRLLILRRMGGIYLDTDVYVINPLDELLYAPITMGMQGNHYGLCPAVIAAAPHTSFIQRFIDSYTSFWDDHWDYNAVQKPLQIAREHPDEIQVVSEQALFWPAMNDVRVYYNTEYDFDASGQFTFHAWNKEHVRELTPEDILQKDTSFNKLLRRYMGPRDSAIATWEASTRAK